MATILLVDDDALQASLMLSILRQRFGDVRRVTDAAEALCLIEQPEFANRLRLIIAADQTPGIGGPAFVRELHIRMPHLPVLVLGSAAETAADYGDEHVVFLAKPLVVERMLAITRQLLDDQRAAVA